MLSQSALVAMAELTAHTNDPWMFHTRKQEKGLVIWNGGKSIVYCVLYWAIVF